MKMGKVLSDVPGKNNNGEVAASLLAKHDGKMGGKLLSNAVATNKARQVV